MRLDEVEKHFGVKFPKKFREIHDTGAMEYLELSLADFQKVREGITLIPFAQTGRGDMHLLVFEGDSEPKVVTYPSDTYDPPMLCGRSFDECLYYAMLDALQWDEDMNGAAWQYHLNYLGDEYRAKIAGKSAEQLLDDLKELGLELDREAINIFN